MAFQAKGLGSRLWGRDDMGCCGIVMEVTCRPFSPKGCDNEQVSTPSRDCNQATPSRNDMGEIVNVITNRSNKKANSNIACHSGLDPESQLFGLKGLLENMNKADDFITIQITAKFPAGVCLKPWPFRPKGWDPVSGDGMTWGVVGYSDESYVSAFQAKVL